MAPKKQHCIPFSAAFAEILVFAAKIKAGQDILTPWPATSKGFHVNDSTLTSAPKFNPDSEGWPCEFPLTIEGLEERYLEDMAYLKRLLEMPEMSKFTRLVMSLGNDIVDFVADGAEGDCMDSVSHLIAFIHKVRSLVDRKSKEILFMSVNGIPRLCFCAKHWNWKRTLTHYECTLQYNKEHGYEEDFDYFKAEPVYFDTLDEYVEAVAAYMRKDGYAF